jgi:hypothetical protein
MENENALKRESAGIGSLPLISKQKPLEQKVLEQVIETMSPMVDQSPLETDTSVENLSKNTIRSSCHR